MSTTLRTALILTLALAATPAFAQQDVSKVNGGIVADAGQAYGDLETVNGGITIKDGAIVKDASTVNGGITVGDKAKTGDLETVNGGIRVGRDATIDGGIEAVNGDIFVDRGVSVREDIENVNGGIGLVAAQVGGGIETVAGDVTVGVDSHVKGGITLKKNRSKLPLKLQRDPRIVIGPNAVVDGPLVFERAVTLYVHKTAKTGPVSGATAQVFDGPTAPKD